MANVQVEEGHLKIADALVVAMCREEFSAVQMRVLLAIMSMTFRVGKVKASISRDDLRYATGEKAYKVQKAVGELIDRNVIFAQHLTNGERLLGIQKDYEQWLPKMGNTINSLEVNKYISTRRALPKMGNKATPPGRMLTWMLGELNVQLTLSAWRKEYSKSVELYTQSLELAHSPRNALVALKDYFEQQADPSFRARVTRPASYLLPGFKAWYKAIPSKSRDIAEQEQITGRRFRYNLKTKHWEQTNDRI